MWKISLQMTLIQNGRKLIRGKLYLIIFENETINDISFAFRTHDADESTPIFYLEMYGTEIEPYHYHVCKMKTYEKVNNFFTLHVTSSRDINDKNSKYYSCDATISIVRIIEEDTIQNKDIHSIRLMHFTNNDYFGLNLHTSKFNKVS